MQDVLFDVKNGKLIDWRKHKLDSTFLAESFFRLGFENKATRVHQCGSVLMFKEFLDGQMKLHQANFCKVRLCPMCAWRRSLKVFGQVSNVMNYLTNNFKYKYIFVTFTVKSVSGDSLPEQINKLFKAFNLLTKRKEFKAISNGWFRCLEVTHNWERDDYHPHFHMVIAVNSSYFKDSKIYLSQSNWTNLWKSCLDVDYNPIVDVRTVKSKDIDKKDYKSAVAEVAKYVVKSADYMAKIPEHLKSDDDVLKVYNEMSDKAILTMDLALHNRRLVAFGGKFKEIHKLLNLDDVEDGDLINTGNEDELRYDLNFVLVKYMWNIGFGNYIKFN